MKKLYLKKESIVNLNASQMKDVNGGNQSSVLCIVGVGSAAVLTYYMAKDKAEELEESSDDNISSKIAYGGCLLPEVEIRG